MKVKPEQLARVHGITAYLKEIPKGRLLAFKAMHLSDQPLIQQFLNRYYRVPERDRICLTIEAIAVAAKINVAHLWGEISLAMREHSATSVKVIAVTEHPDVMRRTIEDAKTPGGWKAQEMVHTMLGALAPKGGPTFINKFFAGKSGEEDDGKDAPEELVDDLDYMFPDASQMQERVQPMRQKLLEARK